MVAGHHKQQPPRWHLINAKMASIGNRAGLNVELSSNYADLSVFPKVGILVLCYNGTKLLLIDMLFAKE